MSHMVQGEIELAEKDKTELKRQQKTATKIILLTLSVMKIKCLSSILPTVNSIIIIFHG